MGMYHAITAFPNDVGIVRVHHHDDVKLPCHVTPTSATNVTWLHRDRTPVSLLYDIYINGLIYKNLRHRFSIDNAAEGDYTLTILDIQPDDAGRYRCFDQQLLLQGYIVFVTG